MEWWQAADHSGPVREVVLAAVAAAVAHRPFCYERSRTRRRRARRLEAPDAPKVLTDAAERDDVPVGARVEVVFEEVGPGQLIHEWRLVS